MIPKLTSASLLKFVLAFVPAVAGIICHEAAHGWAAYKQGDPSAKSLGRLTLNPLRHIDPAGLFVFALTALFSPFAIGWAKPVPVNPRYFKDPRKGMMLVALAGPLANFIVAFICAGLWVLILWHDVIPMSSKPIYYVVLSLESGILINCALGWFNLMPIPPLDGSRIVAGFLPANLARSYESIGRYGMIIIIVLLATGVFSDVIGPLVKRSASLMLTIFGV